MTIVIDTPPELEEAIAREAEREGLTREEFALRAVSERAFAKNGNGAVVPDAEANQQISASEEARLAALRADIKARMGRLSDLFEQWDREDATDDPEELARRQREGDEFMASLRANRFNIPQDPALVALIESMDG
jgi:hypothetical protein